MKKIIYCACLLLILYGRTYAMIYYVDATNGNDGNDGMSNSSPWKTMGKVNNYIFKPGDSIQFKRGETWRDTLIPSSAGENANYITFGAYGNGNKPKLLSSIFWNDPNGWQNEGSNIWHTVYSATTGSEMLLNTSFNLDSVYWKLYVSAESGASAAGSRTGTAREYYSAPGGYKISSSNNGKIMSDVQFITSTSNMLSLRTGKYYRLEFKAMAAKPFTIGTIALQKNGYPYTTYGSGTAVDIGTSWKTYVINFKSMYTSDDGRITFFLGNSFPVENSFYIDDISLREYVNDFVPSSNVGIMIFNGGTSFGSKKLNISNLKSQGDFYDDSQSGSIKLYSSINPSNYYKSIEMAFDQTNVNVKDRSYLKFENLWISQSGHLGFGITDSNHIEIRNCDISQIGGSLQGGTTRYGNGILLWDSTSDIVIENNRLWEIYDAAITTQGTGIAQVHNHTYRNNVVWNSEYGFEFWHGPAGTIVDNVRFENNTIIDSGKGWGHDQRPDGVNGRAVMIWSFPAAKSGISIKYNVFVNATESLIRSWEKSDMDNMVIDNNYYSNSLGLLAEVNWGNSLINYSMSQSSDWITQQNKDAMSIFSSKTGLQNYDIKDYSLAYNSEAIDKGDMTSRTTDINGNPIYGAPDIGAYEYQPPHRMGINKIDITAGARVYGDGQFRDKGIVGGNMADLVITPQTGFKSYSADEVRPHWIDISNIIWNSAKKEWVESLNTGWITGAIYTVGDLEINKYYRVKINNIVEKNIIGNNCNSGTCRSDIYGKITFTYIGMGNYEYVFTVENVSDTTPPSVPIGLREQQLQ